jgi:hypothetical protein
LGPFPWTSAVHRRIWAAIGVLITGNTPREGCVEIFEQKDASGGYSAHEGRKRTIADPRRGERHYVDIEHQLPSYGMDKGAFAGAWDTVQQVSATERNAAVCVPL